jgi:hypothetical protein
MGSCSNEGSNDENRDVIHELIGMRYNDDGEAHTLPPESSPVSQSKNEVVDCGGAPVHDVDQSEDDQLAHDEPDEVHCEEYGHPQECNNYVLGGSASPCQCDDESWEFKHESFNTPHDARGLRNVVDDEPENMAPAPARHGFPAFRGHVRDPSQPQGHRLNERVCPQEELGIDHAQGACIIVRAIMVMTMIDRTSQTLCTMSAEDRVWWRRAEGDNWECLRGHLGDNELAKKFHCKSKD